jgi:tRNA A37 threonylcarbamoyladenosine modification protein TsaB
MKISVLVISIANPILVGVYEDEHLSQTIQLEGKTSDILPTIFDELLKKYTINEILYVNGPGSYMAIKIAYIFLKTISQTLNIDFQATIGFHFNSNSPIKALGKKYFHNNENNEIELKTITKETLLSDFKLPDKIDYSLFTSDTLPIYGLPAVS